MLPSAVYAESTFNGVEGLYVVPFVVPEERDTVQKGDTPKSGSVTGFTANTTVKTHYMTEDSDLPVGTNAFLCYAKAKPINGTAYDAATDGSLTENLSTVFPTIPTVVTKSLADITFSLTPIQQEHATVAAVKILEYMNSIAEAGNWNTQNTESDAGKLFKTFTNKGEGFGGSLNNILVYVNDWYTKASSIAAIGTNIQEAIHNTEKVTIENGKVTAIKDVSSYPDGLPDGGAVITWNDTYQKFEYTEVKWNGTAYEHDDKNDLFMNYTYPAQRYFYANSRIYTSNSSQKTAYSASDWTTVLSAYENQGTDSRGVAVNTSTRSVVVKNPLRYGVAGLEIMIKANTATDETGPYLLDDDSKHEQYNDSKVRLTDGEFPLTAVIIGSQVKQNYCFEPANLKDDNQEYVIYDTQVQAVKTNETDSSTVYLGECRNAFSAPFYTIGLQTKDELSMKVVLEFENNSGKEFISENGVICNGTKFYMMATVVPPGDMGVEQRVLTRGYMTTIKLTIGSLKSAYNALPNLRSDKLRLFDTVEAGIRKWEDGQTGDHEVHNW